MDTMRYCECFARLWDFKAKWCIGFPISRRLRSPPSSQFEPSSFSMNPHHRRSPEYNALLLAGPRLGPLKQAHVRLVVAGQGSSLPLTTKLATLAVAAGAASYAYLLAATHPAPDSFLFCTLTRAAAHRGLPAAALTFYHSFLTAALPFSSFAFTAVAKACADRSMLRVGMAVHAHAILLGFGSGRFVQKALVVLYSKCGQLAVARKLFGAIRDRSVVAWNAMISGMSRTVLLSEQLRCTRRCRWLGRRMILRHL